MSRCIACSRSTRAGMSASLLAHGLLRCTALDGDCLAFDSAGEPVEHRTPCSRFAPIAESQVTRRMERLGRADYRAATPRSEESSTQPSGQA